MRRFASLERGTPIMEALWILGIIALWYVLQAWVLPKFGIST